MPEKRTLPVVEGLYLYVCQSNSFILRSECSPELVEGEAPESKDEFMKTCFNITPLTREECTFAAQLHQAAFYNGWDAEDFELFLKNPFVFGLTIQKSGMFCGYILWTEVMGEAEILTIVIAPSFQRMGMGQYLLNALIEHLKDLSVSKLFLEVAEDNEAAIEFYKKNGFTFLRKRPDYYARPDNRAVDGLSFVKQITRFSTTPTPEK